MEFGIKGGIEPGEAFNMDEALGAVKSTYTEPVEQEATKEEVKEDIKEEPKAEEQQAKTIEDVVGDEPKQEQPKAQELNEDAVLGFINKQNNTSFSSLEEYQASLTKEVEKQVEVEKVVNPYEDILDDEDRSYLEFKKSTGRSYKDYLSLQKDWDAVSDADLARARVKEETGLELNNSQADEYLASELGIDLEDLEGSDKIKFQAYANKYRKQQKEAQAELKKSVPKELPKKQEVTASSEELVTLQNGQQIPKAEYDKLVSNHKTYLQETQKAVDGIADISFNVNVNDNGESRSLSYKYDITEDDKREMLSLAESGVNSFIKQEFYNEDGKIKIEDFQESMFFAKKANRQKFFNAVANQIRAEVIEEFMKDKNNVNFSQKSIGQDTTKKAMDIEDVVLKQTRRGFGVIGNI